MATRAPLKKAAPDDDVLVETFIDTSQPVKPAEDIGRERAEAEKSKTLRDLELMQKSAKEKADKEIREAEERYKAHLEQSKN